MNTLFEIASGVKSPIALGGIVMIALFLLYRTILKKLISQKLTKKHIFKIINRIMTYLFILALVAIIVGALTYTKKINRTKIELVMPSVVVTPSETLIFERKPPKFPSPAEKQKYASTSVNKDFSVIHFTVEEKEPFPIIKFTLMNGTEDAQVITKLKIIIHEYAPYIAAPHPLVLKPLVVWDIKLPHDEGTFEYKPSNPILIPSDSAASINLRLFHSDIGGPDSPHRASHYTLKFVFICARGFEAETPFFILWDEDVLKE